METISNNYPELLGLIAFFGFLYIANFSIPEGGVNIKYTGQYLVICGVIFIYYAYTLGLKNPEIWYLWYAILIFIIFAIREAFKSIWKRFIKYIIREIKEDNK